MKPYRNIWLMYAIALLQGMVFYGPIAALYRQSAGVTIFQITIIESISLGLCLLLELPWGVIADRIGYKKTMLFCCCLYFLSKIVFWKAEGFLAFLAERIMLSIVISGLSGVENSILYLSDNYRTDYVKSGDKKTTETALPGKVHTQKIFGIYNNMQTLGLLIASFVYAVFVKDNYRLSGLLTVWSYGFSAVLAFFLTEVKDKTKEKAGVKEFTALLKQTLQNKYLIFFLIGVALLNETHQTITVFLNQLQYVRCGLSGTAIGYIYIGITIVGMAGVFSERLTRKLGITLLSVILYGAAFFACIILGVTVNAVLSVGAIVILRVSFSLFGPLQTELQNKLVRTENRATELSINAVIIDCTGIGTNVIFGRLADAKLLYAMLAGAVLCFAGFWLFMVGIKNAKKQIIQQTRKISV
ncbi:MFS transporter [Anaerocolumna sp. AGMB13025]|uniref:MFS transporter n=1 Tax=Anaerocolumna sp. AGMB13025 TaxID=3039116 RepID=UPI00241BEB3E|nr:MFS transporter [Anaerocolumna sp. AGMB13025]WFR55665.1 MFS transporter [Anaerocolumna sp. AGMB13025]